MPTHPGAGGRRSNSQTRRSLEAQSDAELVAKCANGDASAWEVLVHRYKNLVYAIPLRMGLEPSDADDVFQTSFTHLAEAIHSLQEPGRVRAWLVTTARRVALRTIARARARANEPEALNELPDLAELPPEEMERMQNQDLVRRAMDRLDDRCRSLLTKLYYGNEDAPGADSYASVAKDLGMPVGSVGPTRLRCLQKLLNEFRWLATEPVSAKPPKRR